MPYWQCADIWGWETSLHRFTRLMSRGLEAQVQTPDWAETEAGGPMMFWAALNLVYFTSFHFVSDDK